MFLFVQFRVFRRILMGVLLFSIYAYLESEIEERVFSSHTGFPPNVQALLGVALSVLLVFRNNASYDRWWEGRKLWGALVNESRNLGQIIANLAEISTEDKRECHRLQADFPPTLRDHLRLPTARLPHEPLLISQRLYALIVQWPVSGPMLQILERHVATLMDICGACERIRRTPLPLSYRACVPQLLIVYLLALPWGMENSLWTVAIEAATSYFLLSIEFIAEDLEEPFGTLEDDLPLDSICATIQGSLGQVYGQ
jgi:putative membrane protein